MELVLVFDQQVRDRALRDVQTHVLEKLAHLRLAHVSRVRPCPVLDFKFVVLGHNTIWGAAGAAVLNAELLKAKGYLEP